jgi:hypothetical protein
MYAPILTTTTKPLPRCPESEIQYFQRVAAVRRHEIRQRRRERRIARVRSLVHRSA